MKCPHCGQEANIPDNALANVETYGNTVMSVTKCCGRGVWINRVTYFKLSPVDAKHEWDHFGRKLVAPRPLPN